MTNETDEEYAAKCEAGTSQATRDKMAAIDWDALRRQADEWWATVRAV